MVKLGNLTIGQLADYCYGRHCDECELMESECSIRAKTPAAWNLGKPILGVDPEETPALAPMPNIVTLTVKIRVGNKSFEASGEAATVSLELKAFEEKFLGEGTAELVTGGTER